MISEETVARKHEQGLGPPKSAEVEPELWHLLTERPHGCSDENIELVREP